MFLLIYLSQAVGFFARKFIFYRLAPEERTKYLKILPVFHETFAFGRFKGHWQMGKPLILEEKLKSSKTDFSLADMLVTINARAETLL